MPLPVGNADPLVVFRVYFRSAGYIGSAPGPLVEGHADDARLGPPPADVDGNPGVDGAPSRLGRTPCRSPCRATAPRSRSSPGRRARRPRRHRNRRARCPRSSSSKPTSRRPTPAARWAARASRPANSPLSQADDPPEACLEQRRRLVHVLAVQPHRRLETQGIAGAEADRAQPGGRAGIEQRRPDRLGGLRSDEQLEAVLARVTGAGDGGAHAGDLAVRDGVVAEPVELHGRQRLQDLPRSRTLERQQGVAPAGVDGHRVFRGLERGLRSSPDPCAVLAALTTSRKCSGARR